MQKNQDQMQVPDYSPFTLRVLYFIGSLITCASFCMVALRAWSAM